jgi:hypothetical protein
MSPLLELLVGREDDGLSAQASLVDHAVEHVGRVVGVLQVAHLVDDQDVRLDVCGGCIAQGALRRGACELIDEVGGGDESSVEAVLDGPVGQCDRNVGLAAPWLAREDEVAAFGDELRTEEGPQLLAPDAALKREVELLDGLQIGEVRQTSELFHPGVGAIGDLFGDQKNEELPMGPALGGSLLLEVREDSGHRGEVEPLEHGRQVDVADVVHAATSCSAAATSRTV